MYWASEIEGPVVRRSGDKKMKGCFERGGLCVVGGGVQKGLAVVAVCPVACSCAGARRHTCV